MPEENASVFQNSRVGIQSLIGTGVVATFLAQTFGFSAKAHPANRDTGSPW